MSTNIFQPKSARKNLNHQLDNELYVLLAFQPPAMDKSKRAPLNLGVAMDVSGSMMGGKLDSAKKSLLKLIEHLTDQDTLNVVSFSDDTHITLQPMHMTVEGKKIASQNVSAMRTLGSTNLSGGVLQTLSLLKSFPTAEGTMSRALAFTDGAANIGIIDPDQLVSTVREFRGSVGVSTFGYGKDHNPVLLNKLAQDGSFYYIDNPDRILTVFGQELGGLISTFAQNVKVTLEPKDGVEIVEVLNDITVQDSGAGKAVISCDDLLAEQPYSVVLKVKVGKRDNAHPRDTTILVANVSYFDLVEKKEITASVPLKVRFVKPGEEDTKDDPAVADEVALQMLGKATREAEKLAQAGNYGAAKIALAGVRQYCSFSGTDIANSLDLMARGLQEDVFGNQASYLNGGSQTSNALSNGITRRRAAMGGAKIGGVDFDALYSSNSQKAMAEEFETKNHQVEQVPAPSAPHTNLKLAGFTKTRSTHQS